VRARMLAACNVCVRDMRDGAQMEVWTLPKPGMGGELGERPTAERYAPERDIEGRRHYIYLLRRPLVRQ